MLFAVLFQASQLQRESPLLSSPTAPAVNSVKPADKSAKKRSRAKVSRVDIEISSNSFKGSGSPAYHLIATLIPQLFEHIKNNFVAGLTVASSLLPSCQDEKTGECPVASLQQQW